MSQPLAAIAHAVGNPSAETPLGVHLMAVLLGHSTTLGAILAAVAFASAKHFEPPPTATGVEPISKRATVMRGVLGASNLLFLCVGLTGTMFLVNNNLVRAFAIAAAVALVRFRVKLDAKSTNATLLFAVLAGIACGLREISLAWILVAVHVALAALVVGVVRVYERFHPEDAAPAQSPASTPEAGRGVAEVAIPAALRPRRRPPRLRRRGALGPRRPSRSRHSGADPTGDAG